MVCSGTSKLNELKSLNFDVVALQEMCWKGAKHWEDDALNISM